MSAARYEAIIKALEDAHVRYVIAGGFAVNLHGFLRFTKDLDLILDLDPANASRALQVLGDCGLQPRLPIAMAEFADAEKRRDWIENRNMLVFQIRHPDDPMCSVDVFVHSPIEFEALWPRATEARLGTTACRIAAIEDLITMKRQAGRPQDLRDIDELVRIQQLRSEAQS